MSDVSLTLTGDWNKAGVYMKSLAVRLFPAFETQITEDGDFVLQKMQSHIDSQDLSWTPLSQRTIELKGGDDTIMIVMRTEHDAEEFSKKIVQDLK